MRAAERAGVKRFLFFSAIGASLHSPARFFRAKALAEEAVEEAELETTIFAPSITYCAGRSVDHPARPAFPAARGAGVG